MRKLSLFTLIGVLFLAVSVRGQNFRTSMAEKLEQNIGELADRVSQDFFSRSVNKRDDVENLLVIQQLKAAAETFLLLTNYNRANSELLDAADYFKDLSGKFSSRDPQWLQIKRDVDELHRELKDNNKDQKNEKDKNTGVLGKLNWQGTIDDEVHLVISGGAVQAKTISGTEYFDGIFSFTSPFPDRTVRVFVNKKEGRGSAKVIQQPTAANNFTAIVQVLDKNGGAKPYELEIYWTN